MHTENPHLHFYNVVQTESSNEIKENKICVQTKLMEVQTNGQKTDNCLDYTLLLI